MSKLVYDIEADGLLDEVTKIHCLSIIDIDTGKLEHYPPKEVKRGLLRLYNAEEIYCHNQINFDVRLIKKFYPKWRYKRAYDTLLLSQLMYPDIGKHGLAAWGERFGIPKPEIEDWSIYDEAMRHRVNEDVKINYMLYKRMKKELDSGIWEDAIRLEQEVMEVHNKQVENGVAFNKEAALSLLDKLNTRLDEIDGEVRPILPQRCVKLNQGLPVKKVFKKDGTYTANVLKYFEGSPPNVRSPYSRIGFEDINIGSPDQIKKYLFSIGWQPDEWNNKKLPDGKWMRTSPKITESSLESIGHTSFGKIYLERMITRHRRNFLQSEKGGGLLSNVREDGHIESQAITIGTPTGRYRHRILVNMPGAYAPYGEEIRSLLIAAKGGKLLGTDLAGVEARLLCHYCYPYEGGPEFAELVLNGDFHSANAELWGVDRPTSKTILYALLYGAGDAHLGKIAGGGAALGKRMKAAFAKKNPAYAMLLVDLKKAYKIRKYLVGLDGRKIVVRSPHKLLNCLIQSAGSILAKRWMLLVDKELIDSEIKQWLFYHDELGYSVSKNYQKWCDVVEAKAEEAGLYYNLNIPIAADSSIGDNYFEIH